MTNAHQHGTGKGPRKRQGHNFPVSGPHFTTQSSHFVDPNYPFQPLPTPNGPAPYRFDLSQLLPAADIASIKSTGSMVFHTVGDTGDYRNSGPQDLVAQIMTQDIQNSPDAKQPA